MKVPTVDGHPVPSGIDGPDLRRHQLGDGSEPQVEKVRGGGDGDGSNVGQQRAGASGGSDTPLHLYENGFTGRLRREESVCSLHGRESPESQVQKP